MKTCIGLAILLLSTQSYAAWGVKWKRYDPFNRNSAVREAARSIDPHAVISSVAGRLAMQAREQGSNYDDCVIMVTTGISAYLAKEGAVSGPWGAGIGAALGAGGGIHAARIACGRVYS